jgi:hypothetical protein
MVTEERYELKPTVMPIMEEIHKPETARVNKMPSSITASSTRLKSPKGK